MQHLERYTNTLLVFGFNSGRHDLNPINHISYPTKSLKKNEPPGIKKANATVSFKFGYFQLLGIMKFLGGATTLDSFLKAYKANEFKEFFSYEWFDTHKKLDEQKITSHDELYS